MAQTIIIRGDHRPTRRRLLGGDQKGKATTDMVRRKKTGPTTSGRERGGWKGENATGLNWQSNPGEEYNFGLSSDEIHGHVNGEVDRSDIKGQLRYPKIFLPAF